MPLGNTPENMSAVVSVDLTDAKANVRVAEDGTATAHTCHRLHLFSLDLSGRLGLRSGGMGISVPSLPIRVSAQRSTTGYDEMPKAYRDDLRQPLETLR